MNSTRKCRTVPLSKQPLALVLIQLRYSPILNLKEYIPVIQDRLRKIGFPLVYSKNMKKLVISSTELKPEDMQQWKFETPDKRSSVIVDQDQALLQTTDYHSFEEFLQHVFRCFKAISKNH